MAELKQELIVFWRQLGRLLDSGVPLLRALNVAAEETESTDLRTGVQAMPKAIEGGSTFSDALAQAPQLFSLAVRTMVRTGELTGRLDQVCLAVASGVEDGSLAGGVVPAPVPAVGAEVSGSAVETPAANAVERLVRQALRDRASDLHFASGEGGWNRVRLRIDGVLREIESLPADLYPAVVNRIKAMACMNVAEARLPQDGRVQMTVEGKRVDWRIATFPWYWGWRQSHGSLTCPRLTGCGRSICATR